MIVTKENHLIILRDGPPTSDGRKRCYCLCRCGNECLVRVDAVKSGQTRSCGCLRTEAIKRNYIDITNKRFGRWVALHRNGSNSSGQALWTCRCDCGNISTVSYSTLANKTSVSCGCFNREQSSKQRGPLHPNWNFELNEEDRLKLGRKNYQNTDWRCEVLKRDSYTCQKCYKRGGKLQCHHINNYSEYKELRYKLDNGVTLCKNCHNSFHKIYGLKTNKEHWISFIKNKG